MRRAFRVCGSWQLPNRVLTPLKGVYIYIYIYIYKFQHKVNLLRLPKFSTKLNVNTDRKSLLSTD